MKEKIEERLNAAIGNMYLSNFEKLFPLIVEDLEYILFQFKEDYKKLSPGEQLRNGDFFQHKINLYFSKLAITYFRLRYDVELDIIYQDSFSPIGAGGYDSHDDVVYYSDSGAILSKTTDISFLHTCLHEGRHKIQQGIFQTSDIMSFPPYMLFLLKENILINELSQINKNFYSENYEHLYSEDDSALFARNELDLFVLNLAYMYMERYHKTPKDIPDLFYKVGVLQNYFTEMQNKEFFRINIDPIQNISGEDLDSFSYVMNGANIDPLIAMDKCIKSHPEYQEKYPILKLLFNGNVPKTYKELMSDRDRYKIGKSADVHLHIDELYQCIIQLDPILSLTEMLERRDYESACEFLEKHPTVMEEYALEIQTLKDNYPGFGDFIRK